MAGPAETTAGERRRKRRGPATPDAALRRMTPTPGFQPNPGRLKMFTYRPDGGGRGRPLVVVLHGCGQRAEAFARQAGWLSLADRHGFVVVAAEQSAGNNPNRCFNWFEPKDTSRGQGEAASIAAMVAHALKTEGADPERVFVTGLSAGGAMTAAMLAAYPDVFAAGAVVAGLPYGVAKGMLGAIGAMQGGGGHSPGELGDLVRGAASEFRRLPRIAIWHGEADHTVRPRNGADLASQWIDAHGLSPEGGVSEGRPGWTRTVWHGPGSDRATIELNLVPGRRPGRAGDGGPLHARGGHIVVDGDRPLLGPGRWGRRPGGRRAGGRGAADPARRGGPGEGRPLRAHSLGGAAGHRKGPEARGAQALKSRRTDTKGPGALARAGAVGGVDRGGTTGSKRGRRGLGSRHSSI